MAGATQETTEQDRDQRKPDHDMLVLDRARIDHLGDDRQHPQRGDQHQQGRDEPGGPTLNRVGDPSRGFDEPFPQPRGWVR
ncbi:MAG: hypothetical protein GY698_09070 [Actinomycetia bacterium]|nr:hypothetical protein [Actinomycetes bacterium]